MNLNLNCVLSKLSKTTSRRLLCNVVFLLLTDVTQMYVTQGAILNESNSLNNEKQLY